MKCYQNIKTYPGAEIKSIVAAVKITFKKLKKTLTSRINTELRKDENIRLKVKQEKRKPQQERKTK